MGKNKGIVLEGVFYKTIKMATDKYNKKYSKVLERLYRGWTPEEAFDLVPTNDRYCNNRSIIVDNVKYISIKEACRKYNKNYNTTTYRLRIGWTPDEAFDIIPRIKQSKRKEYKPIISKIDTLIEICKKHDKSYNLVYMRMCRGWTLEEALELNIDKIGKVTLQGRVFDNILDAAKVYNLNKMYIINGLRGNKSIEELFPLKNKEELIINGKKYEYIEELISSLDISKPMYMQKIRKGWYIEEIIEGKRLRSTSKGTTIDGKDFKNLRHIANYYNLNYDTFAARIRRGWSIEDAINQKRNKKKRR